MKFRSGGNVFGIHNGRRLTSVENDVRSCGIISEYRVARIVHVL